MTTTKETTNTLETNKGETTTTSNETAPKKGSQFDSIVSMRDLLECGVHFGHQTKRWNPKMKPYIFTSRNGIHVIDLQQTLKLLKNAYYFVYNVCPTNC